MILYVYHMRIYSFALPSSSHACNFFLLKVDVLNTRLLAGSPQASTLLFPAPQAINFHAHFRSRTGNIRTERKERLVLVFAMIALVCVDVWMCR